MICLIQSTDSQNQSSPSEYFCLAYNKGRSDTISGDNILPPDNRRALRALKEGQLRMSLQAEPGLFLAGEDT